MAAASPARRHRYGDSLEQNGGDDFSAGLATLFSPQCNSLPFSAQHEDGTAVPESPANWRRFSLGAANGSLGAASGQLSSILQDRLLLPLRWPPSPGSSAQPALSDPSPSLASRGRGLLRQTRSADTGSDRCYMSDPSEDDDTLSDLGATGALVISSNAAK